MSDNISDLYPLSPLQQGMLFHVLQEQGSGLYFNQLSCELRGALNLAAFTESWRLAVAAFPILRTAIVWEDVDEPLQVVLNEVELPLVQEDWCGTPASELEARFTSWLEEDRRQGVELGTPPLLRLSLLRTGDAAYRFVFSHHHILLDGWSVPLLIRQVFVLYESLVRGVSPRVEQGRPYRDYIEWLQERGLEESERFWRQSLAGFSEPTNLGRGFPGVDGSPVSGRASRKVLLSATTTEALSALARQHGLTLNTVVQGAWALLLGHHAGTRDVVFGTTVSGRPPELHGVEGMVGLFINTLPVRVRLPADAPLVTWLKELQSWLLELRQHEHSPLVKVRRWSEVPAGTPLFESLFVFENYPVDAALTASLPSLEVRDVRAAEADHHPLTLVAVPGRELRLELAHENARFDTAHVDRMLGQLRHLLESMASRPEQRLGELSPVDAAERQRLLREWSVAGGPSTEPAVLHRLFEAQVARTPDAEALVFGSQRLSYAELDARANQLAHHLRGLGVVAESRVVLCLERSLELIVSMLGVLKAGGVYVPLDPSWPAARRQSLVEDCGATVVLDAPVDPEALSRAPRTAPEVAVHPEQLAYIIYTSGSTGRPKGVLVTHRNVCNTVRVSRWAWAVGPGKRVLQFASASFDASVSEIYGALLDGAALVLASREAIQPGPDLVRLLREQRITATMLTPSVLEVTPPEALPLLETVMAAGEACNPGLTKRWGTGRRFINVYGPTEITICATLADCVPGAPVTPLGPPIGGARLYVLDTESRPVALGVRGELYVGGAGVSRGYFGRPELTAERYVPDPFSDEPGARMYRTGDVVRWMPDGQLEFFGRSDDQVKVRGFRIELGEIEAALRAELSVGEAVVVVRKGAQGESKLVAYVVPAAGGPAPSLRELRERLGTRLPEYMVPAAIVVMEALPLNTSGKVDRKALPAPEQAREVPDDFEPPRTPSEHALAEVWAQVLGHQRVGIHDDFFELGGDSILAIQIISRAAQAGLHVTAKQLFSLRTIAQLAAAAGSAPGVTAEQSLVTGPVVSTPIQRWFFEQERVNPHHYNQALLLALREPWDAALLEQALQHLLPHHDALRLRFSRSAEGWSQEHGGSEARFPLEQVDLSGVALAGRRGALEAHAARMQASLGLEEGRLVRAVLYDLGAGEPRRLLIVIHHLVVDGVSWRVLLTDLVTAGAQLQAGGPVRLPPKTTSFQQWAERLEAYAQTPAVREEADYWLGLPWKCVSRLPVERPGGEDSEGSARLVRVELDVEETRLLLQEVPRAWRARVEEVLLAAVVESFRRWTGASCLQVDLEGHGREDVVEGVDLSRTVGWFTSLYPVLLSAGDGRTPESGLKAAKESLRRVPRRGLGFGVLRYLSRDEALVARLRALPASEVSFNYLGQLDTVLPAESPLVLTPESAGPTQDPRSRRSHRIGVNALVSGGRLQVSWGYGEHLYMRETMEALAQGFLDALRALLARCTSEEAGSVLSPVDFPLARLEQARLDAVVERYRGVEDLYPLSPLQQGMLFHVLQEQGASLYFNQLACELRGSLDLSAFARAWRQVAEAHPILRTAVLWEGVDEPLQVVLRDVEPPLLQEDWRGVPASEHEARFAEWLEADRRRSFELSSPPLCRLALLRTGDAAWRFVFSHHHLLLDGWSVPIVIRQVFALYEQLSRGLTPRMEQARPFGEYIAWLQGRSLEESERFWRRSLAGFSEPTDLGRGTASQEGAGAGRATRQLHLSAASTEALNAFARQHGLTLNTVLQGAWALLLGHHAGTRDVVFGTTVSGRPPELPGVEGMVGLFINTLPVRVKLPSDEPLVPWLQRLQAWLLELRQHEHAPLVKVRRWSEVPAGTPLFESLVIFENYPVDAALTAKLPSLEVREVRSLESDHHPWTLISSPGRELPLHLAYDGARFDAEHVERLLGQLRHLLESMVARPEQRLGELSPVDAAERHRLLKEWSGVGVAPAKGTLLHRLFERWAVETPEAEALVFGQERLTYGEVEARANQLAHHLRGLLGVGAESRVVLSLERSPELIISMLGVLKAGGVYVPVDPAWPAARLQTLLKDSGASRVIAQERTAAWLEGQGVRPVVLDAEETREALASEPRTSPGVEVHPGQLAYVIYTSGSTGKPKGVLVEHRGACNTIEWSCRYWAGPGKRVLQVASASFDVSVFDIFGTFHAGAVLVMAPREALLPGAELLRLLREERVSAAAFTPSVLEATAVEELPALESLVVAGEACGPRLPQRWGVGRRFVNAYGPTEVSIYATVADCTSDAVLVPIGRPLPGVRAYVLDSRLHPVAVGVRGELFLGGVGVARGYLDRPELTAERFLPDPFCDEPGARMYRTGDFVRWLPDGQLDFIGRVDEQVKLRGFRIELGEIEAALCAEPSVGEAVVVLRKRAGGDPWLVAYVVARTGGAEPSVRELRERLGTRLPEYMVPAAFVVLEALPRNTSGKVDRKALPLPGVAPRSDGFVAPRTEAERRLAELWTRTLGVERVGVTDSFFELGGHSLLATQLVSRVRGTFGVDLPLRAVFEAPTLEALARRVEEAPRLATGVGAPLLVARPGEEPMLSFAQQRLWFLDRLQPGSTAYNIPYALRLEGVLDVAALERGLEEVVRRHEALQVSFESRAGEPVLRLAGPLRLPLAPVDLSALEGGQRNEEVARLASEESARPFELSRGPLLRATLLRLGAREHVLLLTVHHIVFDGWSTGLLFQELAALYEAFSRGAPSPLAEPPLQYTDYARWQREWLRGEVLETQLSYWRQRLADSPPVLNLPVDRPRLARRSMRAGQVPVTLSRELMDTLGALAQREGSSLFMVLLAGFQALLARWSGQEDIAVGTPVAGRTRAEVEGLIGLFVNTLVLRTDVSGAPTFRELVARVREVALGAYAHQEVPFEKLVEELNPVRDLRSSPLFQVMFVLQNVPAREVVLPELKLSTVDQEGAEAKLDLTLSLMPTPEGLRGAFSYDATLFEPATIERLARHLETLLAAVAVAPERRVAEVELLVGEERARVLEAWSQGPRVEGPVEGLGRLLERQAARTPEAVALEGSGQRLSYRELEARARRLAHRLRREGVGPEKRVGVLLEKSVEAVVAFWGVQLAGGVYVPLEAVQPPERLAWMAEDASVCAVVTRRGLEARCRLAETVRVVRLEDVGEEDAGGELGGVQADNAAYILYTSGSTGRPKGVVVTHEGACDLVRGKAGAFGVGPESRVMQFSSLGFDVSLWDYLLALAVGGTLYVPAGGKVPLGEELRRELVEGAVTVLALPPSVLALLPDEGLEHLRVVMAAGEACPPELVERWGRGRRFVNGYGPTEVSVLATWEECVPGEGRPPIGRPLANTRAYVLDGAMRPVPPGVAGELYLGGPGLARGYMGRPELTAERFVPDAFSGEPGARLYRTGDVVRWRADGRLDYLGRVDAQVKVNGVRVEPGEVETALRELAGARQAHVKAWRSPSGESRLVAYVVPGESTPREERELRALLRQRLMEAMVPSVCLYLERLPLTSSGKVDGRALPAPEEVRPAGHAFVAPRDEAERELALVWEEVLGVRPVGVTDSFFELGGQSLLAVRLVARLQERLGRAVPLAALFEAPTIEALALRLRTDAPASGQGNRVTLQPEGTLPPVFWVHPVGGNVLCYAELARHLGPHRPFHALQATGLDGREAPLASVEDMARRYVEQVRAVQPEGPYLLGGWSLGGAVAFEMARELRRQGQEVALLALLDSFAPVESPPPEPDEATLLAGFAADLARSAGREVFLTPESFAGLTNEERLRTLWTRAREARLLPSGAGLEELRALLEVARANLRAVARYNPPPYEGRVVLLRARDARRGAEVEPTHGWARLVSSGLSVEDVPGDHHGVLRAPHVGELAERLERWLQEVESGTGAQRTG
jgi:amino acid adenylation domain-containing protein/non-ribosomal peptide synthase protein (TIGR01720 family)